MARGSSEEKNAHQERVSWGPGQPKELTAAPYRNLKAADLCAADSDSTLSSQQSVLKKKKKHPGTWCPIAGFGTRNPGQHMWHVRGLGTSTWQRHWMQRLNEAVHCCSFLHRARGGGTGKPCSLQVWSVTAALLCDWPWRSFVVAPPESCGAAGRRRRTESAATPPAY